MSKGDKKKKKLVPRAGGFSTDVSYKTLLSACIQGRLGHSVLNLTGLLSTQFGKSWEKPSQVEF